MLVIAEGGGFDGASGTYDAAVITDAVKGAATLKNVTLGSLTVCGEGDLTLEGVTVTGEPSAWPPPRRTSAPC